MKDFATHLADRRLPAAKQMGNPSRSGIRLLILVAVTAASIATARADAEADAEAAPPQVLCEDGTCIHTLARRVPGSLDRRADDDRGYALELPRGQAFTAIQLNLCNSGKAPCYAERNKGRSVPEAMTVLRQWLPDVVTLNEICQGDVGALMDVMAERAAGGWVFGVFSHASDPNLSPILCTNGQAYGSGILYRASTKLPQRSIAWRYGPQDDSAERRIALCTAAMGSFVACTTHTSSKSGSVAMAQCKQLMTTALPSFLQQVGPALPVVVGGDFNLEYDGSPDMQDCVPPGYWRKGDGDVQHIMMSSHFAFRSTRSISLKYTDHPGWLVTAGTL